MPTRTSARRADARRNIEAIVDAAVDCLCRSPESSVADIAQAAGVGRVTLYGHFSSRTELVEAAVTQVLRHVDDALAGLDLGGPPEAALTRLVDATWQAMGRSLTIIAAAERELTASRLLELHDHLAARPREILTRGQAEGVFRTDMSVSWMLATLHHLTHGAADEIAHGRLTAQDAPDRIATTVIAAFRDVEGSRRTGTTER